MLFTAPDAAEYISGVILYDETIRQKTKDGTPFPEYLTKARHHSGDQGRHRREAAGRFPGETITEGLDGLRERLVEYYKLGARFAKWRAVIDIADGIPTSVRDRSECSRAGPVRGARQENNIVPDRRAGSADGRWAFNRALRGSDERDSAGRVRRNSRIIASYSKAWC